ncbi:MAG: hypothetical protein ABIG39_03785 [Candidatus Micrarchaeota archaeon]
MRVHSMLLVLLLVPILCLGQGGLDSSIAERLSEDVGWAGNFSVEYIGVDGENYGLVKVENAEMFIVKINDEGDVSLVVDSEIIDNVLNLRVRQGLGGIIDGISGDIAVFNTSRSGENRCKLSLGIDVGPCSDRDSCLTSCARSQYLCLPMAQGIGWAFVDEIVSFSKASLVIDVDLGEFSTKLNLFESENTGSLPKESLLTDILAQVDAINDNKFFNSYTMGGYDFCSKINYRTDSIGSARTKLGILKTRLLSTNETRTVRDGIITRTQEGIDVIESARKEELALLEEIKTNASMEFVLVYGSGANMTQVIISSGVENRIESINKSLELILKAENSSNALEEYSSFRNKRVELDSFMDNLIAEFDSLVKLSNECSASLVQGEADITGDMGRERLEQLRKRKDDLDLLIGPPIDASHMGSIKSELNSIKNQIDVLILEDTHADEGNGDNLIYGAVAVILILAAGIGYWLVKTKKVDVGFLKKLRPTKKAGERQVADEKKAPIPIHKTPTVSGYHGKLVSRGGVYRSSIRITVKGKDNLPVPEGTVVEFKASDGVITPSAITKKGIVFARMAFKKKPKCVTVTVTALGIKKIAKIDF